MKKCIGLFGTCGDSKWREPFIKAYKDQLINFYNPQVPPGTWDPSMAEEEADHLANDGVILFPVTSETYGFGSLAETGFSILNAIRLDDRRDFVIMIEQDLEPHLKKNGAVAKDSINARALVKQHLKKLRLDNVYVVDSLEEMLEVSIQLYRALELRYPFRKFNPQNRT